MKKYIGIFFATVAFACLLTGCGKENKTNEENNGTITEITSGEINSEKENKENEDKNISLYVPQVQEITIPIPQRKPYKKNLFSFLDEEEGMNGI